MVTMVTMGVTFSQERGKRHNVVCDIAAQNKTGKNNQASARTNNRPHYIKEGKSSCVLWAHENIDCFTLDGREANIIIHKLVWRSSTCTMRGTWTSNMVLFMTLLLWALLLDDLWISTCLAKTVKSCIKSEIESRYKIRFTYLPTEAPQPSITHKPGRPHTKKVSNQNGTVKKDNFLILDICKFCCKAAE